MGPYWPISIINPKIPYLPDILTVCAIIFLGTALWKAFSTKRSFVLQLGIIWLLVLTTNVLQGYQLGFIWPTDSHTAYEVNYWSDALTIHDPINFISHYTTIQPSLGYHGRVHPPLPILIMYVFQQISQDALVVNLFLSLISLGAVWFLYKWIRGYSSEQTAQFVALLFGISSAFQIYSMATIDSVIAAVFTATLWAFDRPGKSQKILLPAGLLFLSSLLTFGAVWLIPVMLVIDYTKHKNIFHTAKVISLVAGLLFLISLITNYSYIDGFFIAKRFENTKIFSLTTSGIMNYIVSRLADIGEHIVFLGPYLSLLIMRAIKASSRKIFDSSAHFFVVSLAAICSFLGFIATGAYYTGETARAALYIIPPVLTVLAPYFDKAKFPEKDQRLLFILVLGQTTLIQLFFFFNW